MTLYLIDGNAYIHRAYHAIKNLTTSKGESVNAVYGFTRMLLKILKEHNPDYLAVCMDYPAPTFRHKEFSEYKLNRKETDLELKNQFPFIKEIISALNITIYEKEGFEADDLIATISQKAENNGLEVVIVTGDKDALQLVNKNIKVLNEPKNILYDKEEVIKGWDIMPDNITDFLALAGDSSDNIPGVPGIGEKTAIKLIKQCGNIENIIKNCSQIDGKLGLLVKKHSESAILSKRLATLVKDIPINIDFEKLKPQSPDNSRLLNILKRLEFYSLIKLLVKEGTSAREIKYETILTEEELKKLAGYLNTKNEFSFNFALTTDKLVVGLAISAKKEEGFYIPIGHRTLTSCNQLPIEIVKNYLKSFFENSGIVKITHNLKSQIEVLEKLNIFVSDKYFDTSIASYVLNPSQKNNSSEDVFIEQLGIVLRNPGEKEKNTFKDNVENIEIDEAKNIFCESSDFIMQSKQVLEEKLAGKKLLPLFWDIEMPLVNILYMMEKSGILMDEEYFKKLSLEFSDKLKEYEKVIYSLAGEEFKINSPKQLAYILFDKLGLNPVRKTKTGYSTDEEVLLTLAQTNELPKVLLNYREISKLKSTFVDALIEKINPETKRLHTSFNQTVTLTGRLSSSEPNLQNIPVKTELGKGIRRGFITDKKFIFASFDYSQIDLRVLAHVTKDITLCNAFRQGEDIHTATAAEVFGLKKEEITKEMRNRAKGINFGIVYGQQAYGLSQQLDISPREAQTYIDQYFEKYKGVKKWISETIAKAKETGFVSTLLGRIRYLPEIKSQNQQIRGFAERTAVNTPIQGTSADIIKVAMIKIYEKLKKQNLLDKCKMLLQVHDDLLFEITEGLLQQYLPVIKSEMENAVKLDIPVIVDAKVGKNWADLKELKN
ncbi:MAG: DNA polymerase I [Elusimicrobia bacterium]|nr:DNA polymerase I [Elusimicrobiota bacterium]